LPSDGHAFAAPRVLLTQAMRSRRVSSASKLPDTPGSRLRRVGSSDLILRPKPRNRPPMVLWANHQTPPPCTGSIVHDFVLLVSPPRGPHLVPPSTWSLEPSLLVSPSPGGPSRLKIFRACSSPATTRTTCGLLDLHMHWIRVSFISGFIRTRKESEKRVVE
jgi:hypothetical protein